MSERLKQCRRCVEEKPQVEFHRKADMRDGLQAWCKRCQREYDQANRRAGTRKVGTPEQRKKWNLSRRYGLRPKDVAEMKRKQMGVCAICGHPMAKVCVDHNHETGEVRGLLCHGCNIKLPAVEDEMFRTSALEYLSQWT